MEIDLTWDLFIIVFFSIIIAYSFIVGKNQTLKIIISSYVAIMAADGIGNLLNKYFIGKSPLLKVFTGMDAASILIIMKIGIFVTSIVFLATHGAFEITLPRGRSYFLNLLVTSTYAIFSAGIIVSTILIYISGISIVEMPFEIPNNALSEIYGQSYFVRSMIDHYNLWFSLPAIGFIVSSIIFREGGE